MLVLFLQGGCMRAGFAAGAVMALMDQGLCAFDAAVAVSASVPTLAYFAAGQRKEIERVWRDELSTPRLVSYRNIAVSPLSSGRSILDIDYLVYEVMRSNYPIDTSAIMTNRMACRFAVARFPQGKLAFLRPEGNDIYKIFHAAMCIPGCYPETICIDDCRYVDAGIVNPIPLNGLFDKKTDRILAVLTKPAACQDGPPGLLKRVFLWRYFRRHPWVLPSLQAAAKAYNQEVSHLVRLTREKPPRAFIVSPDRIPPAKFITRDRKKINDTIDLGYRQVEKQEQEIAKFLSPRSRGSPSRECSNTLRSNPPRHSPPLAGYSLSKGSRS